MAGSYNGGLNLNQFLNGIQNGGLTVQQVGQPTYRPVNYGPSSPVAGPPSPYGSVLSTSIGPRPQTSGPAAPSAPAGPPSPQGPSQLDALRAQYDSTRSYLQGQEPQIDSTYNTAKGDIQSGIDQAQNTYNSQDQQNTQDYGKILKSQIQTYKDLGNNYNNYYAGNGLLDSTMYNDAISKNNQALADSQSNTQLQQQHSHDALTQDFNAYQHQASSALQNLDSQYQGYKNALNYAIQNNNIAEAGALSDAINQIQGQADQIQQNLLGWSQQAALMKSQGVDVIGALKGITSNDYGNQVQGQLTNAQNQFGSLLKGMAQPASKGQGYQGRSGKTYGTYQDALLAGDI